MPHIKSTQYLRNDDYKQEYYDLTSRLFPILNNFMQDVTEVLNGNIDFSNLGQEVYELEVQVDSSGNVVSGNQLRTESSVSGFSVIRVQGGNAPSQPFLNFSQTVTDGQNIVTFNNIGGLAAGSYTITIISYN